MHRRPSKIIRFILNAPPIFHDGANESKTVDFIIVDFRVGRLKMCHMFNIINVNAPNYI